MGVDIVVCDCMSTSFVLWFMQSSIQKLYVWYSYLDFTGNRSVFFQQQSPITVNMLITCIIFLREIVVMESIVKQTLVKLKSGTAVDV